MKTATWAVLALLAGFALGAWWYYKHITCAPCQQRAAALKHRILNWSLRNIE